jgi:NAD(P)-dependent dehydrogenase (short-subunit alcohol dehydrogenase family)
MASLKSKISTKSVHTMPVQVNLFTSFNIVKSSIKAMVAAGDNKSSGSSSSSSSGGGSHASPAKARGAGGSIVLVSAALASHGIPNYESMSAAKAAVEGKTIHNFG